MNPLLFQPIHSTAFYNHYPFISHSDGDFDSNVLFAEFFFASDVTTSKRDLFYFCRRKIVLHQDSTSIYLGKKRGWRHFHFFQLRADDTDQAREFHLEIDLVTQFLTILILWGEGHQLFICVISMASGGKERVVSPTLLSWTKKQIYAFSKGSNAKWIYYLHYYKIVTFICLLTLKNYEN